MRNIRLAAFVIFALASGCVATREVRIQNVSKLDFTDVTVAGERFGNVAAGDTTGYRAVELKMRYAALEMRIEGRKVTGQTLNTGAERFTYRIDVADLARGRLDIEVVKDVE